MGMIKKCNTCGLSKPPEAFGINARRISGRENRCKECRRGYTNALMKKLRRRGWKPKKTYHYKYIPAQKKNAVLKRKHGIGLGQYTEILIAQKGACAICERKTDPTGRAFCVDSFRGRVRGLLCFRCMRGVTFLNRSPDLIKRAAKYAAKGCGQWG